MLVWDVDPAAEIIVEYRLGQPPKIYGNADILEGEDIIPGFRVPLAELFRQ